MAKQSVLLFSSLLASAALASPLHLFRRSEPEAAGGFSITEFYDGGVGPHSTGSTVRFTLADSNPLAPVSYVSCTTTNGDEPVLITAGLVPCNDTSVVFSVQSGLRGYFLTVAHGYNDTTDPTVRYTDSATKFLGDVISTYEDPFNPNGNYQYLNHTNDFAMAYFRDTTTAM